MCVYGERSIFKTTLRMGMASLNSPCQAGPLTLWKGTVMLPGRRSSTRLQELSEEQQWPGFSCEASRLSYFILNHRSYSASSNVMSALALEVTALMVRL